MMESCVRDDNNKAEKEGGKGCDFKQEKMTFG